jgi:sulfatase modifying factor 1
MFCHNCGAQVTDVANFCSKCGARPLDTPVQQAVAVVNRKKSIWLWIFGILGLLAIVATISVVSIQKKQALKEAQSTSRMVLIPAGEFEMGSKVDSFFSQPVHSVTLHAFWLDKYEVTNAQYKAFCDATQRAYPPDDFDGIKNYFTNHAFKNYPVVAVTWVDAKAYAKWAGKRLPTEAEWEYAAKGVDNYNYPWGNTWIAANANIGDNPADRHDYMAPVGTYTQGKSQFGCYDMAGNVGEWCEDYIHNNYLGAPNDGSAWNEASYLNGSPARVMRGGAWIMDSSFAGAANRGFFLQDERSYFVGFRCAKTP